MHDETVSSKAIDEFLGLKTHENQVSEPIQAFNPAKPEGSSSNISGHSHSKKKQVRLKQGQLDTYSAELLTWVTGGCQVESWNALIKRKGEDGAPTWLDSEAVGLDDLSHRVLALVLAHLVHIQGGVEPSPFEEGQSLNGGCLLRLLKLTPPHGLWELAQRLAVEAPLRSRGYITVEREWSKRHRRSSAGPVSVANFLQTDLSLCIGSMGFLLGLERLEEPEALPTIDSLALPGAVRVTLERLLKNPPPFDQPFSIFLKGPSQSGRRTLASHLARLFNRSLKTTLPGGEHHQPGECLLVELPSHHDEDDWNALKGHQGWMFLKPMTQKLSFNPENRADLILDLSSLSTDERSALWNRILAGSMPCLAGCDAGDLVNLDAPAGRCVEAAQRVARSSQWEELTPEAALERLKTALTPEKSEAPETAYAEKLKPVRSLDELCLAPEPLARFQRTIAAISGRKRMLANWKLDPGLVGRAQAVCLFHGSSGTGKSLAAEVLAHQLALPLWRIEAAQIESPYVSESEARLQRFFASVKGEPAVLLLDEVETLLMNRSTTTGSTKRYQDNFVNTFLRELDRFEGILVMTTNHADSLDPAVERRIQFRMEFESPTAEVRSQIWSTLLGKAPIPGRESLDFMAVANRYAFSGGRIRNAFMNACQRAAEAGAISQEILLAACEEEQQSSIATQPFRRIRGFGG